MEEISQVGCEYDFFTPEASLQLLTTIPRHEKLVATGLETFGIPYYLPLMQKVRKYKKGRAIRLLPLFPTYVFIHHPMDKLERFYSLSKHIRTVLDVPQAHREQLFSELSNIKTMLSVQAPVHPCDELQLGQKIIVRSGPFRGLEGLVVEKRGAMRFITNIHMLGRSLEVEIDPADLKQY